ncbi:rRNA biogenesis protein rrp5, partial [Teratosphaeriaceae sp. CCFEE 6253]
MAALKRKAVTDERPAKKTKSSTTEPTTKKAAKPAKKSLAKDDKKDVQPEKKVPVKSILQQEDRAFPRGGGSLLTPLEQKQIQAQADRDVLFEQTTGQKAPARDDDGDGELFDEEEETAAVAEKTKKTKSAKSRREGEKGEAKVPGSGIRIQGLSYKTLVVGAQVLGYVTAITARDIALALPNNLTGYVPLTAVSQTLTSRIEKLLASEEKEEADDGAGEGEDVDLHTLFHVGQWLRATVTATGTDPAEGKSKRHIELSVDPSQVNGGLEADSVVVHSTLQASVRSVEDHGLIMDLGLATPGVKGFVSKKELGPGYEMEQVQEGQVLLCLVTGKGGDGKVVKLSPDASRFSALSGADKHAPVVNEAPSVDAFLPGTAVNLLVVDAGPGGVAGKVMGMLDTTADLLHSGAGAKEVDLGQKYKIGTKIKGRIIWTLPPASDSDSGARRVGISLLDHLLALPPLVSRLPENASPKQKAQAAALEQQLPLSAIIDSAIIARVLPERGLFLSLPTPASGSEKAKPAAQAFAHISQVADTRLDVLSSSAGAHAVGSTHRARVIAFNPVDGLYYVSLRP